MVLCSVGHSFGSIITASMLAKYGEVSDGAILTGFGFTSQLANIREAPFGWGHAGESACRFRERGSGYIVQQTKGSIQQIHLKKGMFDAELLEYAEANKETTTIGQSTPLAGFLGQQPSALRGPIQVCAEIWELGSSTNARQFVLGEFDFLICNGDCKGTYSPDTLKFLFPVASDARVYLQPGTGHALTLHKNATAGYQVSFSYLDSFGL